MVDFSSRDRRPLFPTPLRAAPFFLLLGVLCAQRLEGWEALAACPNSCSLVGTCGRFDACACPTSDAVLFYGGDCSLRRCPFAPAFVDPPLGDLNHDGAVSGDEVWPPGAQAGEAHFPRECGGAGLCDTATGRCACFPGYEGAACARVACPGSPPCSGRGVCVPVAEAAALAGAPSRYNLWDAEKGQACVCDPGYGGPDCSLRECALGPPQGHEGDVSAVSFSVAGGQRKAGYRLTLVGASTRKSSHPFAPNASSPVFALSSDVTARYEAVWARNVARVESAVRALPGGGGANLLDVHITGGGGDGVNDPQLRVSLFFAGPPPGALVLEPAGVRPGVLALSFPPGNPVHWFTLPGGGGAYSPSRLQVWLGAAPQPRAAWAAAHGEAPQVPLDLSTALAAATSVAAALSAVPHLKQRGIPMRPNKEVVVVLGSDLASYVVMVLVPAGTPAAPPLRFRHGNAELEVQAKAWSDSTALQDNFEAAPWEPCAGRGACDERTGLCRCFAGASGPACGGEAVVRGGAKAYPPQPPASGSDGSGGGTRRRLSAPSSTGRHLYAPHRALPDALALEEALLDALSDD